MKKMVNTIVMDHNGCKNHLLCDMYVVYFMKLGQSWLTMEIFTWSTMIWSNSRHISTTSIYLQWTDLLFRCRNPIPRFKREGRSFCENCVENVGDALTFWILTEDTEQLIMRTVIRTAEDAKTVNQRLDQLQQTLQEPITRPLLEW